MTSIDWQKSYEIFILAAEQDIEEATQILRDLALRVDKFNAARHPGSDPLSKPGMAEAMFEVEKNLCRIDGRVNMELDPQNEWPFYWHYWRDSLPQGRDPEANVPNGKRAFELATAWAGVTDDIRFAKLTSDMPKPDDRKPLRLSQLDHF